MRYAPSAPRVAMVSEHASPLAAPGGPDAGGQNSTWLSWRGISFAAATKSPFTPVATTPACRPGHHVRRCTGRPRARRTAGSLPKDELVAHMPAFGRLPGRCFRAHPPDVVHAHFWMSGMAALAGPAASASRRADVPRTGDGEKGYQGADDTSPAERIGIEARIGRACRRVLATCTDEVSELTAMGLSRHRISVVPCGVDPTRFVRVPEAVRAARAPRRLVAVGRLVPRKGFDGSSAPWPGCRMRNCSSPAGRKQPCSSPTRRPRGSARSRRSAVWRTGCGCWAVCPPRRCPG